MKKLFLIIIIGFLWYTQLCAQTTREAMFVDTVAWSTKSVLYQVEGFLKGDYHCDSNFVLKKKKYSICVNKEYDSFTNRSSYTLELYRDKHGILKAYKALSVDNLDSNNTALSYDDQGRKVFYIVKRIIRSDGDITTHIDGFIRDGNYSVPIDEFVALEQVRVNKLYWQNLMSVLSKKI